MRSHENRGSLSVAAAPSSPSPGGQRRVITMELLGRGAHASPREGCCVLEYVSVLAGERWGSRPLSVHPALADVADVVNDLMTDGNRRLLAPLAPWLPGTSTAGPLTWPALIEVCVRAALAWASEPDKPRLMADLDVTRNWLTEASQPAGERRRAPWASRQERRWARHAIGSVLGALAASADHDAADARLCQVLADCVNECRHLAGQAVVDPRLPLADCPQRLMVEPHMMWAPGCDWMELGYRPVAFSGQAAELRDIWRAPGAWRVRSPITTDPKTAAPSPAPPEGVPTKFSYAARSSLFLPAPA